MMAAEGPFLAAVIARLPDPKYNLAAHGVAFAFAILIEAPVIMLMSASTALVEDAVSYGKLRNFANALNIGSTLLLLAVLIPTGATLGFMQGVWPQIQAGIKERQQAAAVPGDAAGARDLAEAGILSLAEVAEARRAADHR